MSARTLTAALQGRWHGSYGTARCPAHADRRPSLSITERDGKLLVKCHAGCDQALVIAVLRARELWENGDSRQGCFVRRETRAAAEAPPNRDDTKRTEGALRLWEASLPAFGTPAETYLRSRGLHLSPPVSLRFHAGLKHPAGSTCPAMIALVTRGTDDAPLAIHRTFLAWDGASKAPVAPQRMLLGPCRGGAVRLAEVDDELGVSEGIESGLSVQQATGLPVWAALSTSGLTGLVMPARVRRIVILADGDEPGEKAAQTAAARWCLEGREVRIARPPRGCDFNDMLLGRTPRIEGDVA